MRISDWSSDVCSSDLKGLKPLLEQLGIHGAELVAVESHLPDQVGPVGGVERHAGQGLVHGNERLSVAPDALALAECLGHRLAEHDAAVLSGVVVVDVQIALRLQRDVDPAEIGRASCRESVWQYV